MTQDMSLPNEPQPHTIKRRDDTTLDLKGSSPLLRAAGLFENLGASIGLDIASFEPSTDLETETIEKIDWDRLSERGLL